MNKLQHFHKYLQHVPRPTTIAIISFLVSVGVILYFHYETQANYLLFLLIFIAVYAVFIHLHSKLEKRRTIFSLIFALPFSVALIIGSKISITSYEFALFSITDILSLLALTSIIAALVVHLLAFTDTHRIKKHEVGQAHIFQRRFFWLIAAAIILLCWLPYYLAFFPGLISVDSLVQFNETLTQNYSNWHPILHTLFLGIFINFGEAIHNLTIGIALAVFMQMVSIALIYGYLVSWVQRTFNNKVVTYCILGFFALCPVVAIFAIVPWKDVAFSSLCVLLFTRLWDFAHPKSGATYSLSQLISIGVVAFIIAFFRNGGIFITLASAISVWFICRPLRKQIGLIFTPIVICIFVIQGPIYRLAGIDGSPFMESLSIPAQQIAYVVKFGALTAEQTDELQKFADIDKLRDTAQPAHADNAKVSFDYEAVENDKAGFLQLWSSILKNNFGEYVKAYILHSSGYWSPQMQSWTVTPGNVHDGEWMDAEYYDIALLGDTTQDVLFDIFQGFSQTIYLGWSTNVGLLVWLVILSLLIFLYQKQRQNALTLLFILAYIASLLIASPVSWLLRYGYQLFLLAPILIATWLVPRQDNWYNNKRKKGENGKIFRENSCPSRRIW